jgi:hypothetical protein
MRPNKRPLLRVFWLTFHLHSRKRGWRQWWQSRQQKAVEEIQRGLGQKRQGAEAVEAVRLCRAEGQTLGPRSLEVSQRAAGLKGRGLGASGLETCTSSCRRGLRMDPDSGGLRGCDTKQALLLTAAGSSKRPLARGPQKAPSYRGCSC